MYSYCRDQCVECRGNRDELGERDDIVMNMSRGESYQRASSDELWVGKDCIGYSDSCERNAWKFVGRRGRAANVLASCYYYFHSTGHH